MSVFRQRTFVGNEPPAEVGDAASVSVSLSHNSGSGGVRVRRKTRGGLAPRMQGFQAPRTTDGGRRKRPVAKAVEKPDAARPARKKRRKEGDSGEKQNSRKKKSGGRSGGDAGGVVGQVILSRLGRVNREVFDPRLGGQLRVVQRFKRSVKNKGAAAGDFWPHMDVSEFDKFLWMWRRLDYGTKKMKVRDCERKIECVLGMGTEEVWDPLIGWRHIVSGVCFWVDQHYAGLEEGHIFCVFFLFCVAAAMMNVVSIVFSLC